MTNPTIARAAAAIAIVAALALGIAVLVQSARGQQDDATPAASVPYPTADPNATPTRTAEETSDYSEAAQATAHSSRGVDADKLVANGSSVAAFRRIETNASVGAPLPFDEALKSADAVVVGTVEDQVLVWEVDPTNGERSLMLASLMKTAASASATQVREPIQLAHVPAGAPGTYDQVLAYNGVEPLHVGENYAVLARRAPTDDAFDLIYGHAYEVGSDGRLSPVFDRDETAPAKGLTPESLATMLLGRSQ